MKRTQAEMENPIEKGPRRVRIKFDQRHPDHKSRIYIFLMSSTRMMWISIPRIYIYIYGFVIEMTIIAAESSPGGFSVS